MVKTTNTSSSTIVEECVEFARRNGGQSCQVNGPDRVDRRTSPRRSFVHNVLYCPIRKFSENHTKPARMLNISRGGIALRCSEAIAEGAVIHIRLPLTYGKTAWVSGQVIHCSPEGSERYWVGIALILNQD